MIKNFFGIFIDSNIFVSYARKEDDNHKRCKKFVDSIVKIHSKKSNLKFFVSRFSGVETASALRRKKTRKDAEAFLFKKESIWEKIFLPLPPNPKERFKIKDFVMELIEIALKFGTDFSDTLQTHTIDTYKKQLDYVITEDKDFKNRLQKKYKRIEVYSLRDNLNKIFGNSRKNFYLIDIISKKSGISKKEIERKIEAKRTRLSGLISKDGAAQIIAAELGIKFRG